MSKLPKNLAKHPKPFTRISYEGARKKCTENSPEIEVTTPNMKNTSFYSGIQGSGWDKFCTYSKEKAALLLCANLSQGVYSQG